MDETEFKVTIEQNKIMAIKIKELKTENEDLKKQILKQANAKIQLDKLNEEFGKDYCNIKQCLDEIEKYCRVCKQARTLNIETILQFIKQVKEGR